MSREFSMAAFGMMVNAMGGGGDFGQMFPASDAQDFADGARYIPGEVTLARRRGETVTFDRMAHQWTMPDGSKIPAEGSQCAVRHNAELKGRSGEAA